MTNILIRGDGIAARCCEHLLRRAGFHVVAQRGSRTRVPAIMLAESALFLIRDVFENADLFRNAPRIEQRVVAWGADAVKVPHSAIVVSETDLLEGLGTAGHDSLTEEPAWTVRGSLPLPATAETHHFGSRNATAIAVNLHADANSATCWIESLEGGWLFLIPDAARSGWLLCVGGEPAAMIARSKLIAPRVESFGARAGTFAAWPRITSPLCGSGWIACGAAAMAFDPICGDGTANAIREAILAAAVIRGVEGGGDADALFRHYHARLTAGFARHLEVCQGFYLSGGSGPWWAGELESVRQGLVWCAGQAQKHGEFRYRLNGFQLEAR